MCFYPDMKIQKIQPNTSFKNTQVQDSKKKPEFIDKFMSVVQNQDDVNDCVAVPRGIFKAYLWIMGGFGLIGIGGALPAKMKGLTMMLLCLHICCHPLSGKRRNCH